MVEVFVIAPIGQKFGMGMVDTSDIHIIGQIPAYTKWVSWHYVGDGPDAISRGITYAPTKIGTDWPRILWFWGISPPFGPKIQRYDHMVWFFVITLISLIILIGHEASNFI